MATHRIELDVATPLVDAPDTGHNRWHPDVPPVLEVAPGDVVVADLRDGLDVQFTWESGHDDVLACDLRRGHPLTGPIVVEGAEPGDLVTIEVLAIEPDAFGWTCVIPGMGLLGERFQHPYLARWRIEDGVARSPDVPGVAVRGEPFLGLVGVAPSHERLRTFAAREGELAARGGAVPQPDPGAAVPASGPPALEGLRTVPPRETGGNMDVKQLGIGSTLVLGVDVPGALVSLGDAHFSQGDGESCCSAIELHARATVRIDLRRGAEVEWRPRYPVIEHVEPARPAARRYIVTTGIPIEPDGRNEDQDLNVAARAALGEMVDHLVAARGLSPEQAYVLVSAAADLRIGSVPNVPNVLVTCVLPLDVFEP